MPRATLYFCALLAACGSDPVRLDSKTVTFETAFFLTLDERGEISRITSPFGIDGGTISYGQSSVVLKDGEAAAVLVTIDDLLIERSLPGFVAARRGEMKLEVDQTFSDDLRQQVRDPARIRLSAEARWFDVDLGASTLVPRAAPGAQLVLSVPNDPEFCGKISPERLRSITPGDRYIPAGTTFPGYSESQVDNGRITSIHVLDGDRFLVSTPLLLMLVRRGGMFDATKVIAPSVANHELNPVSGLALGPKDVNGVHKFWAIGYLGPHGKVIEYAVAELELTTIGTSTTTTNVRLRTGLADAEGNLIAAGDFGSLILKRAGSASFERFPLGTTLDAVSMTSTPRPDQPHLIGLKAQSVVLGDAVRDALSPPVFVNQDPLGSQNRDIKGVAASPDGEELWAVGEISLFARFKRNTWSVVELPLPPSAGPCVAGEVLSLFGHHNNAVWIGENFVYVATDGCSAIVRIDRRLDCVAMVPREGVAIAPAADDYWSLAGRDGRVYVGGTHGTIFEVVRD